MRPRPFSLHSLSLKALRLLPWLVIAGLELYNLYFLVSPHPTGDFGSFIASGQAATRGENPYGIYALTARAEHQDRVEYFPNMNPPVSLLFFELMADVQPFSALQIWVVVSIVIYITGLILLRRVYRPTPIWFAWGITLAGFWDTLMLGQIYIALFFLVVLVWLSLREGRDFPAGILIGILAAFKPNLLVWPAILFLAGYRRPASLAVVTTLILSAIPLLRYPPGVYQQWLAAASQASWTDLPHYLSVFGLSKRFGVSWLGWPVALALLASGGWWAWRRRPLALAASEIALILSILVSPLATPRFTLFLMPVFFLRFREAIIKLPAALFLIPTSLIIWIGFQSQTLSLVMGVIYPLGLLLLLSGILRIPNKNEELKYQL